MKKFFGVNSKIVLKNTFSLASAELLIKLITLLWIAFLGRSLSISDYGRYSYVNAFIALFALFPDSGAGLIVVREIAQNKKNQNMLLSSLFYINLSLALISCVVIVVYGLIKESLSTTLLISLASLSMFFTALRSAPIVKYESHEKMNVVAILNILNSLLIITLPFILFLVTHSILGIFMGMAIGGAMSSVLTWVFFRKSYPFHLTYNAQAIKKLFLAGLPLGLAAVASMIFSRIDSVMLNFMVGLEAVGRYNSAVPIVFGMIQLLHVPFAMAIYPTLSRVESQDKKRFRSSLKKALVVTAIWTFSAAIGISLFAPVIVPMIFGSAYQSSSNILQMLIFILPFASLSAVLYKILIIKKRQKIYLAISVFGAIANILLNIILIPSYGVIGAAGASVLTQIGLFVIYAAVVSKSI
ncbi:hypothetical protein A2957_00920 [Candidatus Roizmanbacteria bacterium RIFCSPLOWO2_01_FULL_38_11]|uniref:Uncharacterized protein n=1 Tax=Candidatus Roizmanbacteria bacterium RIFCSPLOWO2_01_FULL_38_11 TaxID=1802060 RepID=A0A1F7IMK5_9BACT|nr:MAG: hypothetical protein A2957_00920 [Candidatus Roizmanbacteria bacterium RIFCSPLOWO2_01_FULL_38_11]